MKYLLTVIAFFALISVASADTIHPLIEDNFRKLNPLRLPDIREEFYKKKERYGNPILVMPMDGKIHRPIIGIQIDKDMVLIPDRSLKPKLRPVPYMRIDE